VEGCIATSVCAGSGAGVAGWVVQPAKQTVSNKMPTTIAIIFFILYQSTRLQLKISAASGKKQLFVVQGENASGTGIRTPQVLMVFFREFFPDFLP
jgi:hypothetical protein